MSVNRKKTKVILKEDELDDVLEDFGDIEPIKKKVDRVEGKKIIKISAMVKKKIKEKVK
jgi:hypothetical protein